MTRCPRTSASSDRGSGVLRDTAGRGGPAAWRHAQAAVVRFQVAEADPPATAAERLRFAELLTEKTIEVHLTSCYRKLEIGSRTQLARALPAAG